MLIIDEFTNGRAEPRGIPNHLSTRPDGLWVVPINCPKLSEFQDARPDHSSIANQLEHHVLGEDAPSPTSPAFDYLVDDRD